MVEKENNISNPEKGFYWLCKECRKGMKNDKRHIREDKRMKEELERLTGEKIKIEIENRKIESDNKELEEKIESMTEERKKGQKVIEDAREEKEQKDISINRLNNRIKELESMAEEDKIDTLKELRMRDDNLEHLKIKIGEKEREIAQLMNEPVNREREEGRTNRGYGGLGRVQGEILPKGE